jgi:hypothetical protein
MRGIGGDREYLSDATAGGAVDVSLWAELRRTSRNLVTASQLEKHRV